MRRRFVFATIVLLSGCSDAVSNDTVPSPTDGGITSDTAAPPSDWPEAYATLEQQILDAVNQRRAAGANCGTKGSFGPAAPLVMHPVLTVSAREHSEDMATRNFFNHNTPEGETPFDRMKAAGYTGTSMAENIAAGNPTAAATMEQWMGSDGHCANIMNPKYTQLGVGYFPNPSAKLRHYWTQNFGAGG